MAGATVKESCRWCLDPQPVGMFAGVCQSCYFAHRQKDCICVVVRGERRRGVITCPTHGKVHIKPSVVSEVGIVLQWKGGAKRGE